MKIPKIYTYLNNYILITLYIGVFSCKPIDNMLISLRLISNEVQFLGKTRLQGVAPIVENTSNYHSDSNVVEAEDFSSENIKNPVVKIHFDQPRQTAVFYLHPSHIYNVGERDYIGVFFNTIENMEVGNAAYKYGPVKAWTHPVVFRTYAAMPEEDIQFLLWKYTDGVYAAAIPLGGNGYVGNIGKEGKNWGVKLFSNKDGHSVDSVPALAVAFGKNPYETVQNVYTAGLQAMGKPASLRKNKTYPAFFERLAWCTWNSFGHTLSEEAVIKGIESFKKVGVSFPVVLLDDGWSAVSEYGYGKLKGYEPDIEKFPTGLKSTIDTLKQKYGVQDVGVWHAFNGYWAGIEAESALAKRYANDLYQYKDVVAWKPDGYKEFTFVNPLSASGKLFYEKWYEYLKNEGVSFVKVDNQLIANRMTGHKNTFSETAEAMQQNMQGAVKKFFDGNVLNCMDMTTDAVYNYGSSPIGRSSEDFFPENSSYNLSAGNAAIHVLCNLHNSLWWSQMVWPDFDMFQTHHEHAEYHAVARAISGGPIYFADSVGKTNPAILAKLSLEDGQILRADTPALLTEDCLFNVLEMKPLKSFTISNGCGMLAAFHAFNGEAVMGTFCANDVYGMRGKSFAVYDYKNDHVTKASLTDTFSLSLNQMEWKLFFVKPVQRKFAGFGMVEKYNAPKTVLSETVTDKMALVQCLTHGTYKAYCGKKIKQVVGSLEKPLRYTLEADLLTIHVPKGESKIAISFE